MERLRRLCNCDAEDDNYNFSYVEGRLTINKKIAALSFSNLEQSADGSSKIPQVITNPPNLNWLINWQQDEAPTEAGSYEFTVIIDEENYEGESSSILVLTPVLEVQDNSTIEVYPNPSSSQVRISSFDYLTASIFDLNGRLMLVSNTNGSTDVSQLEEGVYIIKLRNADGDTEALKLIIKK